MKNKEIASAAVGGLFFAVPYLVLSAPIIPSLLIGAAAFGAGELVFGDYKLTLKEGINESEINLLKDKYGDKTSETFGIVSNSLEITWGTLSAS